MRPNVLLIILDAARRDAFEPYGAAAGSSPVVAQLASRGKALDHVYATAPWTVPSHASIFTGLLPRAAALGNVESPPVAKPIVEAHRARMLPEILRRAGYSTAGVSANFWASGMSGFDAGFDDFDLVESTRRARLDAAGFRDRARWTAEAVRARADDGASEAGEILERRIGAAPRQPFFWFVNLVECHSPYLPPRPYRGASTLERVRAAADARRYYTLGAIWRACGGALTLPEATLDRMRRLYRASIAYMDDWIGRLLERLDGAGVLDDTLVIVTADHGENFGENGLIAHGLSLDERLIHVPFVAAGPGSDRVELASLADVPRRLAEAAGIDDHPYRDGPPAGIGVAQSDPPGEASDPKVRGGLERLGLPDDPLGRLTTPLTCAVADGLKLMRRGDREEVYDLAADPLELSPLDPAGREPQLSALRRALDHPSMVARTPQSLGVRGEAPAPSVDIEDLEQRMKLLGYM